MTGVQTCALPICGIRQSIGAINTMAGGNTAATGLVQGFKYTYTGVAGGATYTLQGTPLTVNNTGTRSFFANETGLIRHCTGTTATVTDPTIDAAPVAC